MTRGPALGILLAVLAACGESTRLTDIHPQASTQATAIDAFPQLVRAVAVALNDDGLRHRVFEDLRHSPFREHKLEFSSYLHGESGGILLAKMADGLSLSREEVLSLIGSVRPLEFYMPVRAHRDAWAGGEDLLLAGQLVEDELPVAYDLAGRPVMLSLGQPPEIPTLVLVPVETDFSAPAQSVPPQTATAGKSVEPAYIQPPPPGGGGVGGGDYTSHTADTPGIWLTKMQLNDLHEPWTRGSPEIDVFVFAPSASNQWGILGCAGQHQAPPMYFDQNDNLWVGRVLLTPLQHSLLTIYPYPPAPSTPIEVSVWEDDTGACQIYTDADFWNGARAYTYATAYDGIMLLAGLPVAILPVAFLQVLYLGPWLTSNDDDYEGLALKNATIQQTMGQSVPAEYAILNGATVAGYLEMKWYNVGDYLP